MDNKIIEIIDESVKLELNASTLYSLFYQYYLEDSDFWWELQIEEKNHASLLKSIKDFFIPYDKMPDGLLVTNLDTLKQSNNEIEGVISEVQKNIPTRLGAFEIALELEQSATEIHFQMFMEGSFGKKFEEVIRTLNREDKDHYERIKKYMKDNF